MSGAIKPALVHGRRQSARPDRSGDVYPLAPGSVDQEHPHHGHVGLFLGRAPRRGPRLRAPTTLSSNPTRPLNYSPASRAILRRARPIPAQQEDLAEDLELAEILYVAVFRGKRMTLSAHEWQSLRRLASTVGMVVPREELSALLWGDDPLLHTGALDRCIEHLNYKLSEGSPAPACIKVLPGGFRLTAPAAE
jgi:hypothetical protein